MNNQQFESYVPVYDTVPETWEQGREFLIEQLKKISEAVNARTIGWLLDEELLSGQQFIPPAVLTGTSEQYRSVLRKVVDLGSLTIGLNAGVPHGVIFDANFTLIDLWVSGTDTGTLTARRISGNDVVMDATNIVVTSPQAFNRSYAFIEYIQEL